MDDRLALLVGRVILAWGLFDQQLHATIVSLEMALDEPHKKEGRFNERRKLFRRYAARLAPTQEFVSDLDRFCGQLQKLETLRGRIAHGWANEIEGGIEFYDHLEAIDDSMPVQPPEWFISFDRLERLPDEIEAARGELIFLQIEAIERREAREGRPTLLQLRRNRKKDRPDRSGRSKPSDRETKAR